MLLSYLRTGFLYLLLLLTVRLMGKRQVGQMEPSEFVVTMLVANLAAIPMQDGGIPLYSGVVPILLRSFFSLRSIRFRRLLCGKPVILIENGRILRENLKKTRVTLDELSGHLREKEVLDPRAVQYAILETNGNLSVFPYPKEKPASARDAGVQVRQQYLPITVVSDGYLLQDNLTLAGKDVRWLQRVLREHNASVSDTWLLTVDGGDHILWYPREEV